MKRLEIAGVCLRFIVATTVCAWPMLGGYAVDFPIADLVTKADAILVGSIIENIPAAIAVSLRIAVDRVLKGNVASGSVITIQYEFPAGYGGSRNGAKT